MSRVHKDINFLSCFVKRHWSHEDDRLLHVGYRFSWSLFYAHVEEQVLRLSSAECSNVIKTIFNEKEMKGIAELVCRNNGRIEIYHDSCEIGDYGDLAHALLHATCTTKEKWSALDKQGNRWKIVEALINAGAPFTATSGFFSKEYAIDRMIVGNAPVDLIVLALKKGAWIGRDKNLIDVINRDYNSVALVRLKNAISAAVTEIATSVLNAEFAKHTVTPIPCVCTAVVEKVRAEVTRYFGSHSESDIIGVAKMRVLQSFNQRYVNNIDQFVATIVSRVRFNEEVSVSQLLNDLVVANGKGTFSEQDTLFVKRKLLRQMASKFVNEKMGQLDEKNPLTNLDVITNDLFDSFKLIVKYSGLERCVQLDVENALKERARDFLDQVKNPVVAVKEGQVATPKITGVLNRAALFGGASASAALAAPPQWPDNKKTYRTN